MTTGEVWAGAPCRAPFGSLQLDQWGWVRVCGANGEEILGHVSDGPLRDIWHGEVAEALRATMRAGRFGRGCTLCAAQVAGEQGGEPFSRVFDILEPEGSDGVVGLPVQAELAMGNECNLACAMCNGAFSSRIRSQEGLPPLADPYDDAFFEGFAEILPALRRIRFLGGEPFLVRAHHRVWDLLVEMGLTPDCHVTTNGTIWNARVERILERFPVSAAVSLDAVTDATLASIRPGVAVSKVVETLDRLVAYSRARGTYVSITHCLMLDNWHELADLLLLADDRDIDVFVNLVSSPATMSLYRQPPEVLREVVESLEASDEVVAKRLGRNLGVWRTQLSMLRAQLSRTEGDARARATPGSRPGGDVVAASIAAMRDWSGAPPLVGGLVDGAIRLSSDARLVAGPVSLEVEGRSFDDLIRRLTSEFGPLGRLRIEEIGEASTRWTGGFRRLDEVLELRYDRFPAARPHPEERVVMAIRLVPSTRVALRPRSRPAGQTSSALSSSWSRDRT